MVNEEKLISYLNSLFYAQTKPHICEAVTASFDINRLQEADAETQLMTLGALIATEKHDQFSLLLDKMCLSDLTQNDRAFFADSIFSVFSDTILANPENAVLPAVTLQLLTSIAPDEIMAHELQTEQSGRPSLLKLHYEQKINPSVRGVIFPREFFFGAGSRKHGIGYRLKSALVSQGWDVSQFPLDDVASYTSSHYNDFALIDSGIFANKLTLDDARIMLSKLKRHFRKIIIFELDPWTYICDEMLLAVSDLVDYIWGFTADWELTNNPVYRERSLLFPGIGGFDHLENIKNADLNWNTCTFNFTGSVQVFNLNRAYWILESIIRKLPIKTIITTPEVDDGLDHGCSENAYAQLLASTHASLSLTTRKDGSQRITGRPTEILSLNRLLLQERCPAFHQYYVEGEHFLEFSDIEELSNIIDFLKSHPKVAHNICSEGHKFYLERYSCRKLVEYIQALL